nr:MAG TPA: hypothetical protein [Bacteriophage sp.]DAO25915.1 MAG TPA: hypothetical protein [Caudoviricetes sp.]
MNDCWAVCRMRDNKPYQLVFAPKTENMWRIINKHEWIAKVF